MNINCLVEYKNKLPCMIKAYVCDLAELEYLVGNVSSSIDEIDVKKITIYYKLHNILQKEIIYEPLSS